MSKLAETLNRLDASRYLKSEPMSRHTTFHVGGNAEMMFFPCSGAEVQTLLRAASEEDIPVTLIGNGSNVVVRDGGLRGLVLVLGERFAEIRVCGSRICAQAGALLSKIAATAQESGLTGLEFAGGIPGSLGGGCAMNAGAYGGQLSDVLVEAEVLLDGEIRTLSRDEMEMGYRTTLPLRRGGIVLSACFELQRDDPEQIQARMRELNARRRDKQPLNYPSAGSFFKRPEGHFAGALIENCGLKGCTVGGAQVSEKHAGFIINVGGASAADILDLMEHVRRTVHDATGVTLEPEVRILGEQ